MNIEFTKYHGTGNDFIVVEDYEGHLKLDDPFRIEALCSRRFGIGADGLLILQKSDRVDFKMIYFNSDGHLSSFCGNGSRCISHFAFKNSFFKSGWFEAADGDHFAELLDDGQVVVSMQNVGIIDRADGDYIIDTGSPHFVRFVDDFGYRFVDEARSIRQSKAYKKEGINVNYVIKDEDDIVVRTYERGVEDETYSCGTGIVASSIAFFEKFNTFPSHVKTLGGILKVSGIKMDGVFAKLKLQGPVKEVYTGVFCCNGL